MNPFEMLYGRRCNTLVNWANLTDRVMVALNMLKELDKEVNKAKKN